MKFASLAGAVLLCFAVASPGFVTAPVAVVPAVLLGFVLYRVKGKDVGTVLAAATALFFIVAVPLSILMGALVGRPLGSTIISLAIGAALAPAGIALIRWDSNRSGLAEQRHALRTRAREIWQRLYYCYRDDGVFDPSTGAHCPPEAMRQFIRQPHSGV